MRDEWAECPAAVFVPFAVQDGQDVLAAKQTAKRHAIVASKLFPNSAEVSAWYDGIIRAKLLPPSIDGLDVWQKFSYDNHMARPFKHPTDRKGEHLRIPVTSEQKAAIQAAAEALGQDMAAWARPILIEHAQAVIAQGKRKHSRKSAGTTN
jgi:hypothetical protein